MSKTNSEWLALYETALENVLANGQSMGNQGRTFTLADVKFLEAQVVKYRTLVDREAGSNTNIRQITLVDE